MWLINLTISLFSIFKTRALECVSIINRKCTPRPKILDEAVGEVLFYPYNVLGTKCSGITLWQKCAFLISLRE